jgi:hypothetical protein
MHNEIVTLVWHAGVGVQHFVDILFFTYLLMLFWLSEKACYFLPQALLRIIGISCSKNSRVAAKQLCKARFLLRGKSFTCHKFRRAPKVQSSRKDNPNKK